MLWLSPASRCAAPVSTWINAPCAGGAAADVWYEDAHGYLKKMTCRPIRVFTGHRFNKSPCLKVYLNAVIYGRVSGPICRYNT